MGVFRPVSPCQAKKRFPGEKPDFKSGCIFFTPQRTFGLIVRKSDKVPQNEVPEHCYKAQGVSCVA